MVVQGVKSDGEVDDEFEFWDMSHVLFQNGTDCSTGPIIDEMRVVETLLYQERGCPFCVGAD